MIIERPELSELLLFIKNKENVSKEQVVARMKDYTSRITTLKMIDTLYQEGVIDIKKTKQYLTRVSINPDFDFKDLLIDSIKYHVNEIEKASKSYRELVRDKKGPKAHHAPIQVNLDLIF